MRRLYQIAKPPLEFGLSLVEKGLLALLGAGELPPPPGVFIIGPPRSGTTLLYQLLLNRYGFACFTNFIAPFYAAPVLGFWLAGFFLPKRPDHTFESTYGRTRGGEGPHEAGSFWYRWFPKGEHVYVAPGDTPQARLDELRQEVAAIAKITGAPLLFKNTYNSLRIAPIVETLPRASFLVCQRSPVDTAQSILKSRIDELGSKERWWSLPPREIDQIKQHPYWEQVVEQVYYIYRQIEADRIRFGPERFLDVHYRDLCRDTRGTLSAIESFLSAREVCLDLRGEVPAQFPMSTGQRVEAQDYDLIVKKVQSLWD